MKPLGIKPMRNNCPSIDNLSWGKRALNGPNRAFYAMDYDLGFNDRGKKSSRQAAKREIREAMSAL